MLRSITGTREEIFTFNLAEINEDITNRIFRYDEGSEDNWSLSFVKFEQIRRHRKKRINKKWAKKYGYRDVVIPLGNFKVTEEGEWIKAQSAKE